MSQPSVEPSGIMSSLPPNYAMRSFTSMQALTADARAILGELNRNQDNGNQYLLVLSLPTAVRVHLDSDKNALDGIPFRLMFDRASALVKVIPSFEHDVSTRGLVENILFKIFILGVPREQYRFAGTTTFRAATRNKGKQPDDCFLPWSRLPHGRQHPLNWPTLVIESGVSESLPKLREDARWWFENSSGLVRTVIILSINRARKTIRLEKWQLADPNSPTPSTSTAALSIPPPLMQQPAASQRPYAAQTTIITPTTVAGDVPLVLHFHGLFDRRPTGTESDILLDGPTLMDIARSLA